jgi:hypothetical protein
MVNEIKDLRVKIDGLAKLTRALKPKGSYKLNLAMIPKGMSVEDVLNMHMETGIFIYDSEGVRKDGLPHPIEELPVFYKEIEKSVDSLYLAKAWLGIMMKELGEPTPYVNDGKRKTVEDVEPTVDVAIAIGGMSAPFNKETSKFNHIDTWELNGRSMHDYDNFNHIEKVDWLRQEIQSIIDGDYDFCENNPRIELEQGFVYKHLCEARFWLGFELARVREVHKTEVMK